MSGMCAIYPLTWSHRLDSKEAYTQPGNLQEFVLELFFSEKKSIWYLLSSKAHLEDLLERLGLCKTYLKGTLVSILIGWAWK